MSPRRLRRPLALAAVAATGALVLVGATVATASHGGSGNVLTSSSNTGSTTIKVDDLNTVAGPTNLNSTESMVQAAWSADGCRAVFVSAGGPQTVVGDLATIRHNDGNNLWYVTDGIPGVQRQNPSWRGDGADVVWSERDSSSLPSRIMATASSYGWLPFNITPADDTTHTYTNPDAGPGRLVVFQIQGFAGGLPTGTPEVWLYNPALGSTFDERTSLVASNATNPALSPNGSKVAFVRFGDVFTVNVNGTGEFQVTMDGTAQNDPTWSPNGAMIAFNHGGTSTVATAPAGSLAAPTVVTGLSGHPAYRAANVNHVARLFGANRFATAIAVSKSQWATFGGPPGGRAPAGAVVLSRSDTFADALSGSALAAAKEGPLLLTPPTTLNAGTKAEITRILGNNNSNTVYLLGGIGAISQAVQNEINAMGLTTVRLAGVNRFATSIAIANAITTAPDLVLAATGLNFPDALAAGAAAGSYNVPGTGLKAVVVLTADTVLPAATQTYLNAKMSNPNTLLFGIGGQAATAVSSVPAWGAFPLVGVSRYETALFTAEVFFGGESVAGIATGSNWPDALAGGALMGTLNGPLLLTPSGSSALNLDTQFLLDITCGSINTGLIFGGTGVVSGAIDAKIGTWISGPAGFDTATNPTSLGAMAAFARGAQAPEKLATPAGNQRSLAELKSSAGALGKRQ